MRHFIGDLEPVTASEVVKAFAVDESAARALFCFYFAIPDFGVKPGQTGADEGFEGATIRLWRYGSHDPSITLHRHPDALAPGHGVDLDEQASHVQRFGGRGPMHDRLTGLSYCVG
ncbi:hypothetical protein [Streptomyces sp. WAC00263]|uniref:hypothetical protein n=1 Tax=Streptomyces sp. WAC00263 TaxID=1917422 RepID=UPI0015EFBC75|nr:hypothetical protein [Streptomyces sp. WAC00263]